MLRSVASSRLTKRRRKNGEKEEEEDEDHAEEEREKERERRMAHEVDSTLLIKCRRKKDKEEES